MKIERTGEGVYVTRGEVVSIGIENLEVLKREANENKLKRARLCTHQSVEDKLHEMFIVLAQESYVRPHKHIGKAESTHIIEGHADAVFFDDTGNVNEVIQLGDFSSGSRFYYRINTERYHTLLIRSPYLVMHEVTSGPFIRENNVFMPQSPEGKDEVVVRDYVNSLEKQVDSFHSQ